MFGPISAFALDPAQLAANTDLPILIVQGDQDLQVSVADAERIKTAQPAATLTVLPGVNHVLKTVDSNNPAANIAAYGNPDLPLSDGIAATIADFIKR